MAAFRANGARDDDEATEWFELCQNAFKPALAEPEPGGTRFGWNDRGEGGGRGAEGRLIPNQPQLPCLHTPIGFEDEQHWFSVAISSLKLAFATPSATTVGYAVIARRQTRRDADGKSGNGGSSTATRHLTTPLNSLSARSEDRDDLGLQSSCVGA